MIETKYKKIYQCIGCERHCVVASYSDGIGFPDIGQFKCIKGNTTWVRVPEMTLKVEK